MTSLIAYNNRLHDQFGLRTNYTDTGSSFEAARPLSHMGLMQLPVYASFTGATAEFDVEAVDGTSADPFDADVFGLMGHTLPNGAEVEFLDGSTSLGSVTVANKQGLPRHAILVLDEEVNLDTLTVSITNAGSGGRIGAVWASPSFRVGFGVEDFALRTSSLSRLNRASATGWSTQRASQDVLQIRFPGLTRAQAIGPAWPNWRAISRTLGIHAPIVAIPDTDELEHSVYGRVESFPDTVISPSPKASHWRGGVNVIEEG